MPWRECCKMDERLRFVARLLEGEKMAELCREFGISRKTGYKIFTRYKDVGLEGLTDRSRRPYRQANRLPNRGKAPPIRCAALLASRRPGAQAAAPSRCCSMPPDAGSSELRTIWPAGAPHCPIHRHYRFESLSGMGRGALHADR